jgi:hypothetical protein
MACTELQNKIDARKAKEDQWLDENARAIWTSDAPAGGERGEGGRRTGPPPSRMDGVSGTAASQRGCTAD